VVAQAGDFHPPSDESLPEEAVTLEDLARAFAEVTGQPLSNQSPSAEAGPPHTESASTPSDDQSVGAPAPSSIPVNPRSILEALLFVGHPRNEPLSPAQAAEIMRGVRPDEIARLVSELNAQYEASGRPYRIVFEQSGYRMKLLPEFDGLREGFFGKVRQVRLSQQALEVLAIVAYRQPITVKEVNRLRGKPSGAILAQLVRRDLISVTYPDGDARKSTAQYRTTQRFLELFKLQSLEDLPQLGEADWSGGESRE